MNFDERLEKLIDQYLNGDGCGECCSKNIILFYSNLSIEDAILYACDYGKVKVGDRYYEDSHYKKLKIEALQDAQRRLLGIADKFKGQLPFMEVYRLVRGVTEDVQGVNRMFYYDTSVRIAASISRGNVDLLPKDVFYQRGAELGALNLGILTKDKIDEKKPYLPYKLFCRTSKQFERLTPYQIEDFLCIFHNRIDFGK